MYTYSSNPHTLKTKKSSENGRSEVSILEYFNLSLRTRNTTPSSEVVFNAEVMIVRVRTQIGTWRLKDVQEGDTIGVLRDRLEREHATDLQGRPLTRDAAASEPLADHLTVRAAGLDNGAMLYALVDDDGVHEQAKAKRAIAKDGTIVAMQYSASAARAGFRPGMLPLRSMKMQWTLNDFISLDEKVIILHFTSLHFTMC